MPRPSCERHLTDPHARGGEDGVGDGRYRRRQRRFAQARRIVVRLQEFHFDRRRNLRHARRLVVVEVALDDAALVDRDLPRHHVAHRLDERALNQVGRLQRVDDLAADIDGRPCSGDVDLLVVADLHLDDVGHVAGVGELERDALAGAFRQAAPVVPIRHVPHRLEDAARARRVELGARCVTRRAVEQVDSSAHLQPDLCPRPPRSRR